MLTRRRFLVFIVAVLAGFGAGGVRTLAAFEIEKTDAEWRKVLDKETFRVMRLRGTERPFSSPLASKKDRGTYHCAACDLPLFDSKTKYDSGTGWPSFYEPLPHAVETATDYELVYPRTEVHCRRCGGHLGHVFEDGPPLTGKRYCMNGIALRFRDG